MVRRCLQTSGLVAGAALFVTPALAQPDARGAPLQLSIGGYFDAFFVFGTQDDGPGEPGENIRDHGVAREAEVIFAGTATLDNGLEVGVQVQLEAETCDDQIDESYVFFEGGWGRLQIGSEDGAAALMHLTGPSVLPGHGYDDPNISHITQGGHAAGLPNTVPEELTGDSEKLTYFTPRFAGLQLGASYTPEDCEEAGCGGSYSGFEPDNEAGDHGEIVELAANYQRDFGDLAFQVSGSYGHGRLEAGGPAFDDREVWSAGLLLGWRGWELGAGWSQDDLGLAGSNERQDWAVGLSYGFGAWSFSLGAGWAAQEAGAGLGEDESRLVEAAVAWQAGPGVTLAGGLLHYDYDDNLGAPANQNEGTFLALGAGVEF